jgi:hypothetical protein
VNANDPTADPQTAGAESKKVQVATLGILSAKTWRLHARLYNNPEKAELGHAESRQSAPDQWF